MNQENMHFLGVILTSDFIIRPKDNVLGFMEVSFVFTGPMKQRATTYYRLCFFHGSDEFAILEMSGYRYCVEVICESEYTTLRWIGEEDWFNKLPDKDKITYMFNMDYFDKMNLLKSGEKDIAR